MGYERLPNIFSTYCHDLWIFWFNLLIWRTTLVDFQMLDQICVSGINLILSLFYFGPPRHRLWQTHTVSHSPSIWFCVCACPNHRLFVCCQSPCLDVPVTFCPFEGQVVSCIHPLAESDSWSFWLQEKFQPDSSLPRALAIFFCFFVDLRTRAQGLGAQAFASSESFVAGSPLESCTIVFYPLRISLNFLTNLLWT